MYNRYIPQPDGSYRRNRVPDHPQARPPGKPPQAPPPRPVPQPEPPDPPPDHRPVQGSSISGFLRQLLPKDFDTADLIIVLLLLLMAGDNEKERGNALLTIALYFIM